MAIKKVHAQHMDILAVNVENLTTMPKSVCLSRPTMQFDSNCNSDKLSRKSSHEFINFLSNHLNYLGAGMLSTYIHWEKPTLATTPLVSVKENNTTIKMIWILLHPQIFLMKSRIIK